MAAVTEAGKRASGRRVLLVVSGGIAAYKSLELVRLLDREGCAVRAVATRAACEFVTPLSLQTLTGRTVFTDMFSLTDQSEIGHIELPRESDLVVVAPASADILAKMAAGICDDLATTLLLATDKRVLVAPAMNVRMWEHPATRANLETLRARGVGVVGPEQGAMACREYGYGRLAEPPEIVAAIVAALDATPAASMGTGLAGRRAIVTAGPTHEPVDPVRYLGNRSSGRQGYAIAHALAQAGADVTLVSGPVFLETPAGARKITVETALEMRDAVRAALPAEIAVLAAAVADWRVADASVRKLKKSEGAAPPSLTLVANPDILAEIARPGPTRPALVVGFAAETDDLLANAAAKRLRKGCDWIVANDVGAGSESMGGDANTVHLVTAEGIEAWPRLDKRALADRLVERIVRALG